VLPERAGVDDLVVIPDTDQKGEIRDMNGIAAYVVAAHINDLLAQSEAERLAKKVRSQQAPGTIASAVKNAWSLLRGSAEPTALPKLTDYPYRS
jgi:hypothetical protein